MDSFEFQAKPLYPHKDFPVPEHLLNTLYHHFQKIAKSLEMGDLSFSAKQMEVLAKYMQEKVVHLNYRELIVP